MCATEQELNVVVIDGSTTFNCWQLIYFNNVIHKNVKEDYDKMPVW